MIKEVRWKETRMMVTMMTKEIIKMMTLIDTWRPGLPCGCFWLVVSWCGTSHSTVGETGTKRPGHRDYHFYYSYIWIQGVIEPDFYIKRDAGDDYISDQW